MEMSEAGESTFARNEKGDLNAIQIVLQQERPAPEPEPETLTPNP